ncbi:unnamed protein product [Owenia fusiformis]|uniref:TIR domain-containing protein n=1 Tax=Owenia fusiformis TaxID=6347 RepID=A0A8S4MWK2_OWEFU|nr:unnamed protein product [Owenia fusiformis]
MERTTLVLFFLAVCFMNVKGLLVNQSWAEELHEIKYNKTSENSVLQNHQCQECNCSLEIADCSARNIDSLPLDLPGNITMLNLSRNDIKNLTNFFIGRDYKDLQSLDITYNSPVLHLHENVFEGLDKLQKLYIGKFAIVHPLVFKPLKEIRIIEVKGDGSRLSIFSVARDAWLRALRGLQNSTIEKITYEHISSIPFILRKKHFKYFTNCQLKELYLPHNMISAIESGFLNYLPMLEILDLSRNMIATLIPVSVTFNMIQLFKMTHLRVLRLDDMNNRVVKDLNRPHIEKCVDTEWPLPMGLEELNFKWASFDDQPASFPCELKVQPENKLKVLNAAYTNAVIYFGGPLKGLVNLQHLIYNNNDCKIEPDFFTCASGYFESLQVLDLAYNKVLLTKSSLNFSLFENCSKLVHLDLSYNNLADIPSDMLKDASSIETVNLSGNKLVKFNLDLNAQISLELLNLSNNKLHGLIEAARNSIANSDERSNGSLTIDLNGNPLMCTCDAFPFINWIKDHMDVIFQGSDLECQYINGSQIKFTHLDVSHMKIACLKSAFIASGISVAFVLLIVGVVIYGYKRRYKIIYIALHLRAALRRNNLPGIDYDFDGFLSYSSLDKTWAINNIYGQLAGQYGYNICVDDRNFRPGTYLSDIIVESISKSNKIILVISQNFLRSGWCKFEMNLARGELATRGRDCLILILKEPKELLPQELITPTLRSLLDTRVYLVWSEEEDRKLLFWRKLQDALGEPRFKGEEDTPFLYQNNDGDEEMLQNLI